MASETSGMTQHSHHRCLTRERERTSENIWRDNSWKLPLHGKKTVNPSPGSTESPRQDEPKEEHTETHSNQTDKFKDKDKTLKTTREKQQIAYKWSPIRLSEDFSTETLQTRREWHDIFKVMKGKNLQPRTLYLSFRFDEKSKAFQTSKS